MSCEYLFSTVTMLAEETFFDDSMPYLMNGFEVLGKDPETGAKNLLFCLFSMLCFLINWKGFGSFVEPAWCWGNTFSRVWLERLLFSSMGSPEDKDCEEPLRSSMIVLILGCLCLFTCGVMPPIFLAPSDIMPVPVITYISYWLKTFETRFFYGGLWKGTLPS